MNMNTEQHYHYETQARLNGFKCIAGGDEAGRGPWAGPVCAAFVVLPENSRIVGLDDSKKLSRKVRRQLFEEIKQRATAYGIGFATPKEIDSHNILEATRLAFYRAFAQLTAAPDYVLLDYIKLPWLQLPHQAFPKGESISASVAAASILAKEARDLHMEEIAGLFPNYGFEQHMGYGTRQHQQALETLGPCDIHRLSFKPIKALLDARQQHETLFSAQY